MSYQIAVAPNLRKSPFFEATVADGVASLSVYNHMLTPAHYGNPLNEYHQLINNVVMWDVAVERQVELVGPDAEALARYLTPRDISGIKVGQGKYVPICNHDGILINDPVLQRLSDDCFWLSTADSDVLLWAGAIAAERGLAVRVTEPDASPLGVQGPRAADVVADLFGEWVHNLNYFWHRQTELAGIPILLAQSGWSKKGGFELYLRDGTHGTELWNRVKSAGAPYGIIPAVPSDIERTESGLLSYGADARFGANPYEVGLGKWVDLDREDDFVGKAALKVIVDEGIRRRRVGFFVSGDRIDGIEQAHHVYLEEEVVGTVTEAIYSPRLEQNIALGLLSSEVADDEQGLEVEIDNVRRRAKISTLPFC